MVYQVDGAIMSVQDVILDTNFLLVPYQYRIDVLSEIERLLDVRVHFIVPTGVVAELKKISRVRGSQGMAAKFALKLVEANKLAHKLSVHHSIGGVDDWIFHLAHSKGSIICTNDVELKKRAKKIGAKIISMKSRSKIGFV